MRIVNMRLTGQDKNYWRNQLEEFAKHISSLDVEFGKQDIRGGFSISYVDARGVIVTQDRFASKDLMLGFVEGYNKAIESN